MGTSNCHILLGERARVRRGHVRRRRGRRRPRALIGYEAGQSGVGDIFAWFAEHAVPPEYHEAARRRGRRRAPDPRAGGRALRPGESGLLALDWWNGNRSVLVDADLSGLLVGMTLATTAPEIYRALIEATAFGTRVIVDAFESAGVPVDEDRRLRRPARAQRAADADLRRRHRPRVLGRSVGADARAGRGDVRSGGRRRRRRRLRLDRRRLAPDGAAERPRSTSRSTRITPSTSDLYGHYVRLHDLFGRDGEGVMKSLKRIRDRTGEEVRMK